MACNCKNGSTEVKFLTPFPAADPQSYLLQLTHWTCGNKQMCLNNADGLPVISNLSLQQVGEITPLGSDTYCVEVRCVCDLTYQQISGNACCPNYCLQRETCVAAVCVPLTSADAVTLTANGASVMPVRVSCRYNTTNTVSIDVSFSVAQAAVVNANTESRKK